MSGTFVHLHLHSEYSLTDSTIRIASLVEATRAAGMPAVAVTDEANLFALVKFYRAAEGAGLKPIAGCDLWVAEPTGDPYRVTLLCQDATGYRNLSVLLSRAYRERHGEHPIVQRDWLDAASAGLIALAGVRSDVGHAVAAGHDDAALAALQRWQRRFGDRVYLELVRTGQPDIDAFVPHAAEIAARAGCGAIASNDVRFISRDDFESHEARVAIHAGYLLGDPKRPRPYSPEQYLKSPEEMRERFADLPEALDNAVELARRCNLALNFGKYFLPAFPTPAHETEEAFLRRTSTAGLGERLSHHGLAPGTPPGDYDARLALELDVIVKMGFAGYFLIVADFIGWAKHNGIPVGPGRGSGAGSLVAWALGITDMDPLRHDLLFERFLNPERVSMPDFDIDFCMDRRDEVIDYVAQRYGRDRVCQIITYGTMAAKAVLRDTGRVLGMSYGHVDRIAKTVPARPLDITLDDALGLSEKAIREPERISPEFKLAYDTEEDVRTLVDLARSLEDLTRNAGKHAGGVVIAPSELTDFVPLYCEERGGGVVTQFDKDDVESIGLVKFDFLGLRTLTIIDWAVKAINAKRAAGGEPPLDIATIPMDDAPTFDLLKRHSTTAVFQLESRGMKELVRKLQPDTFNDIVALVALFRPGPLQSGMVDDFIARKHGRAEVSYRHKLLEPILKPTYGVIVYQEQVMQIAQVLARYTLGGADLLRRAMGKKKPEEMAKERLNFEDGAAANGVDTRLASQIFDLMEKFAEYGFNKSHSAAYALVSYQTAYLKAHWPSEFMAAVLSSDMDNTDKLVHFLDDAREIGLTVERPDINASGYPFAALDDRTIRYGLGAVKGVGRAAVEAIAAERARGGAFSGLLEFCQRVDASKVNKRVLEALILSGSLDALAANRATLMAQLPEVARAAEQHLRDREAGQHDMFGGGSPAPVRIALPEVPEWPLMQRLNGERATLGHYLSGHPTDACSDWLSQLATCPIAQVEKHYTPVPDGPGGFRARREQAPGVTLAGLVAGVRRRGEQMAIVQLEDSGGRIDASFFRDAFVEYSPLLTKDRILVVEGTLEEFGGNLELRARKAWSLDQACERHARCVRIRLNGVGVAFTDALKRQLQPHVGGSTPLRLAYTTHEAQAELELGDVWRVRVSQALVDGLAGLDGVRGVDLVLGRAGGT
jgi:DNA polymerase-3 subunit alpha